MVDSTRLKKLKATVSSEPSLDAHLIVSAGTWRVRSDLCRDRSKSWGEVATANCWLELEYSSEKVAHYEGWLVPTLDSPAFSHNLHPVRVAKTQVTKSDSPKKVNHVLQKARPSEMSQF